MIPAVLAIGVLAVAATPAAAQGSGYGDPTGWTNGAAPADYYQYQGRRARARPYVDIPYTGGGWVPYPQRGFNDPGFAYHGNINGCAVDLGYGRWEPCSGGR
jgi:hypothetical protein